MAGEEGSRITGSMAVGEEGSRITRSMAADEEATKDAVAAGDECLLKRCQNASVEMRALKLCTNSKAEDEKLRTTNRKAAAIGCSSAQEACYAKSAPGKKMTRLPQEEVARILDHVIHVDRAPADFKALKLRNPDLILSPEEEMDEEKVGYYAGVRAFYRIAEEFSKFQAWVRSEYAKNGYVEVDDDFLAKRARVRALSDTEREHALKTIDFSDEDEDLKRLVTTRWH